MLVVVEVGLITPPFGINLFVLKSLDREIGIGRVMRGVLPFVAADIVKIALIALVPAIALWLPSTMRCGKCRDLRPGPGCDGWIPVPCRGVRQPDAQLRATSTGRTL